MYRKTIKLPILVEFAEHIEEKQIKPTNQGLLFENLSPYRLQWKIDKISKREEEGGRPIE